MDKCEFCGVKMESEQGYFLEAPDGSKTLYICSDCLPDWEKLEAVVELYGGEIGEYYIAPDDEGKAYDLVHLYKPKDGEK